MTREPRTSPPEIHREPRTSLPEIHRQLRIRTPKPRMRHRRKSRKRMKARKLQLPLRPPRRTMRRLSRTAERIPPQRWRSAIQRPRSSRMTTGACRRRRKSLLPRKTAAADGPPMKTAMKSIMPATGKKIRTTIRPVLLPLTTNTFFRTVTSGIIPEKN